MEFISKNLSWIEHISNMVNKANQVLGLIKRSFGRGNTRTFSFLHKSLVKPVSEYAVPVWNLYLHKDIHAIDNVQRRALGQKRGDMSYEDRCNTLNWPLLSTRRPHFSLVECYKIVFGYICLIWISRNILNSQKSIPLKSITHINFSFNQLESTVSNINFL